jgi:ABC-type transport system involved in multi-copper enzyme maturation permease subunit
MRNLLSAELMRLRKSKTIKVTTIILTGILIFYSLVYFILGKVMAEDPTMADFIPQMSVINSLTTLNEVFVLGILFAIIVNVFNTKDYSQGTLRNFIVSGEPRANIYLSKTIVTILATTLLLIFAFLVQTIFILLIFGWGEAFLFSRLLEFACRFLVLLFVYSAFTTIIIFLAHSFKSSGGVIGITIAIAFFFNIFASISVFSSISLDGTPLEGEPSFFFKLMDIIGKVFVGNHVPGVIKMGGDILDIAIALAVAIGTILLFTILGVYKFNKADLK